VAYLCLVRSSSVKITRIILLLIVLGVAAGLAGWIVRGRHSLSSRIFGGREAFRAFYSASAVVAQRLHCNQPDGSSSLADYTREAPIRLSDGQMHELKRVFADRALYSPELWTLPVGVRGVTTCGPPNYGVLFTTQSHPVVQIALCFRCDQFGVFVGDGENAPYVNDDDQLAFMQPPLATLVKSVYPSDAQMQALKPKEWLDLTKR
jgi:hypothetical protein